MRVRPRRSVLFVPGVNARALEKAKGLPVDALILDLEDAVAPDCKQDARRRVEQSVRAGGYGARELVVRINGLDTPWGREDLAAICRAGADAILVPKISRPGEIMMFAKEMRDNEAPEHTRLWAMMETPLATLNAANIAFTAADPASRLEVLVVGTNDLAKETHARLTPGRAPLLTHLSIFVAAARAQAISIVDGVFNDIHDVDGFRAECVQGLEFGMDGKTLIHPDQIAPCNAIFTPDEQDVSEARKILQAFDQPENAGKGVIVVDGRMVERLHADVARRTTAIADAIAERG